MAEGEAGDVGCWVDIGAEVVCGGEAEGEAGAVECCVDIGAEVVCGGEAT